MVTLWRKSTRNSWVYLCRKATQNLLFVRALLCERLRYHSSKYLFLISNTINFVNLLKLFDELLLFSIERSIIYEGTFITIYSQNLCFYFHFVSFFSILFYFLVGIYTYFDLQIHRKIDVHRFGNIKARIPFQIIILFLSNNLQPSIVLKLEQVPPRKADAYKISVLQG